MDELYAEDMRARIVSEPLNLNALGGRVSQDCVAGKVSEAIALALIKEIETFKAAWTVKAQDRGGIVSSLPPRILIPPKAPQILAPKLVKARRKLGQVRLKAKYARIPAALCEPFTQAQQGVLGQLVFATAAGTRTCDMAVKSIAKRSKVSERLVQSALSLAKRLGIITVRYRRRATSLITIISERWLAYLKAKTASSGNENLSSFTDTSDSFKGEEACGSNTPEPSPLEPTPDATGTKTRNHPAVLDSARLPPSKLKAWIDDLMIETSPFGGFATDQPMPNRMRNSTS